MAGEIKKCIVCGTEFISKREAHKCCSKRCSRRKCYAEKRMREAGKMPEKAHTIAKCCICGKEFEKSVANSKYCSDECRKVGLSNNVKNFHERKMQQELEQRKKRKRQKNNRDKITEIAIAARKEGLTYGQYVAKYMGRF